MSILLKNPGFIKLKLFLLHIFSLLQRNNLNNYLDTKTAIYINTNITKISELLNNKVYKLISIDNEFTNNKNLKINLLLSEIIPNNNFLKLLSINLEGEFIIVWNKIKLNGRISIEKIPQSFHYMLKISFYKNYNLFIFSEKEVNLSVQEIPNFENYFELVNKNYEIEFNNYIGSKYDINKSLIENTLNLDIFSNYEKYIFLESFFKEKYDLFDTKLVLTKDMFKFYLLNFIANLLIVLTFEKYLVSSKKFHKNMNNLKSINIDNKEYKILEHWVKNKKPKNFIKNMYKKILETIFNLINKLKIIINVKNKRNFIF